MKRICVLFLTSCFIAFQFICLTPITTLASEGPEYYSNNAAYLSADIELDESNNPEQADANGDAFWVQGGTATFPAIQTEASADLQDTDDTDQESGTQIQVNGAQGASISSDNWGLTSEAHIGDGSGSAESTCQQENLKIVDQNGLQFHTILEVDQYDASSTVTAATVDVGGEVNQLDLQLYGNAALQIDGVYLFDRIIAFNSAGQTVEAWYEPGSTTPANSSAYAYVTAIRVWDPDTQSYTTPVNFNSSMSESEIANQLVLLNTILSKSGIRISNIVQTGVLLNGNIYASALSAVLILSSPGQFTVDTGISQVGFKPSGSFNATSYGPRVVGAYFQSNASQAGQESTLPTTQQMSEQDEIDTLPYTGIDFSFIAFISLALIVSAVFLKYRFS